jgi:hypothetical protein
MAYGPGEATLLLTWLMKLQRDGLGTKREPAWLISTRTVKGSLTGFSFKSQEIP